jgi:ubiquinone/menaquinone biosynthesis C-methylase UbiE
VKMVGIERWFMNRPHHARQAIKRAEKLLPWVNLKPKQNFLEVGCGSGAVSQHVAKKYRLNVTGVDVDPKQIRLAQASIDDVPNVHFLEADATNLPFPDNDFDVVLSFGVMHHISNWLDALREIKRVLTPKGYFIYADLIFPELIARFGRSFKHRYGIATQRDLDSFIKENGFSTIHASMTSALVWYHCEFVYQSN